MNATSSIWIAPDEIAVRVNGHIVGRIGTYANDPYFVSVVCVVNDICEHAHAEYTCRDVYTGPDGDPGCPSYMGDPVDLAKRWIVAVATGDKVTADRLTLQGWC